MIEGDLQYLTSLLRTLFFFSIHYLKEQHRTSIEERRNKMADFRPRNILLIGATGNIGRFITRSIVSARGEFDRVAILTSAPAAGSEKEKFINEELKPKNVEIIVGDISNEEDVLNAYKGAIPPTHLLASYFG